MLFESEHGETENFVDKNTRLNMAVLWVALLLGI
jgi:hypothetical protein